MFDWMWREDLWFPSNSSGTIYSWKQLENQPGSNTYYPQVSDLHWSFIIGISLLGVRYVVKRLFVEPLGHYLNVSAKKSHPVPDIPVLEDVYRLNKKVGSDLIKSLSKQTDLPTRKIEIWFRLRKKKDAPSQMKKFEDCFWHFIFYSIAFIYGVCVLWNKPWFGKTIYCWIGWPQTHVPDEIYWYYILEMAFYWCLILSLLSDHRRKDFTEFVVHHIATMILLYFSWFMNFVRLGTLVLVAHDAADPFLAFAKMSNYTKRRKAKEVAFVLFILVWIISRLIYYPFFVLYSSTIEPYHAGLIERTFFTHWFFNFFLYTLMVLHIMWSFSIARIVINKLKQGEVEDVRSDSDSDGSEDIDDDIDFDTKCDINDNGVNGHTKLPNSNGSLKTDSGLRS